MHGETLPHLCISLIGDKQCGKRSLARRIATGDFGGYPCSDRNYYYRRLCSVGTEVLLELEVVPKAPLSLQECTQPGQRLLLEVLNGTSREFADGVRGYMPMEVRCSLLKKRKPESMTICQRRMAVWLLFSPHSASSFYYIQSAFELFKDTDFSLVLVQTMSDRESSKKAATISAKAFELAELANIPLYKISSRTSDGVSALVQSTVQNLLEIAYMWSDPILLQSDESSEEIEDFWDLIFSDEDVD